jgi:hypothetical protein
MRQVFTLHLPLRQRESAVGVGWSEDLSIFVHKVTDIPFEE